MGSSESELRRRIQQLQPWYHNFNLGGVLTNPAHPEYPESRWRLIEPHIPRDLTGKTVLDLGCNAGYFSIQMRKRGASVMGVDVTPWSIQQAKFVAKYYDLEIQYKVENIYEFLLKNRRGFDYVLFLGLFYHLRYPLFALDKISEITREKMYFQTVIKGTAPISESDPGLPFEQRRLYLEDDYPLTESKVFEHPDYPKMYFIENKFNGDSTNWWFANRTCVHALLRSAGFRNVQEVGSDVFVCDPPELNQFETEDWNRKISRIPPLRSMEEPPPSTRSDISTCV